MKSKKISKFSLKCLEEHIQLKLEKSTEHCGTLLGLDTVEKLKNRNIKISKFIF